MQGSRLAGGLLVLALVAGCSSGGGDGASGDGDEGREPAEVPAAASAGCEAPPVDPIQHERVTLTSGGEERWYLRSVPTAASGGEPLPVVVDLHGYSEGAEIHTAMSELGAFGEEHDFFVVFPHGDAGGAAVPRWDASLGSVDLDFFGDLLDDVESSLCVDTNRVYVTGLSNGAFMTSAVACAYADRVAAVAPVAGVRDVDGCDPVRPVPVVAFHGTADEFVTFDGGLGPAVADLPTPDGEGTIGEAGADSEQPEAAEEAVGPSVPEIVAAWAERDGCEPEPAEAEIAEDVELVAYDCPAGAAVELYVIVDGGHSWPGSEGSASVESVVGFTTFSIAANEVMWEFFQEHPLPAG